jgi:hypothetical protein
MGPSGPMGPAGPPAFDTHIATAQSLYAETTLPDTTPVYPPMTYNGASVTSIPIPAGTSLVITDLFFGFGLVFWTIEVDFGSGFVTLGTFGFTLLAPATSEVKTYNSPITIQGGPGVAFRLRAITPTTPTVPVEADITVRLYSTP